MKRILTAAVCASAVLLAAGPASAHFILMSPDSWIGANPLGDPQKAFPCGVSADTSAKPTAAITVKKGGDTVHIKIKETIYHPGHYRVALAVLDRSELPKDPEATTKDGPRGPISVSGKIDPNPKPPVLADGLFMHHAAPAKDTFWETDIKLPNINCDKCTVQVLQFMEEHGLNKEGEFTYHHCADLKITADPSKPIDKRWPGQKPGA
jgi:hypothetical protein